MINCAYLRQQLPDIARYRLLSIVTLSLRYEKTYNVFIQYGKDFFF